jgi:hypothetical protein
MNVAHVELKVGRTIRGDIRQTVTKIRDMAFEGAMDDLDTHYGGRHWFEDVSAAGIVNPPGMLFAVLFRRVRGEDEGTTANRIMSAFDRHWNAAVKSALG